MNKLQKINLDSQTVTLYDAWNFFEKMRPKYEKTILTASKYVDPAKDIMDVGANIGYFSKMLMEHVHLTGKGYLFEPIPNLAAICRQLLPQTKYNVEVFPFGLGDENGRKIIYTAADGNLGWNTLIKEKTKPAMHELAIEIKRFDGLNLPVPPFIKIDVEGAEYLVLRGLLPAIRKWGMLPVVLCEIGWGRSHPQYEMELKEFRELIALGYDVLDLKGNRVVIEEISGTLDVFFVPS